MKLHFLYGIGCTVDVWNLILPYFKEFDCDFVVYPHELTLEARKVEDITEWVYKNYEVNSYEAIIGHSIGGLIGLQLNSKVEIPINKTICIDTNFKPAEKFYRNLMTPDNMRLYGENVLKMLKSEMPFYHEDIISSVQEKFDFSQIVKDSPHVIDVLYGDRQNPSYRNRIEDLNLDQTILEKLNLHFIRNSCHMIMIENPRELSDKIKELIC